MASDLEKLSAALGQVRSDKQKDLWRGMSKRLVASGQRTTAANGDNETIMVVRRLQSLVYRNIAVPSDIVETARRLGFLD